MPRVDIVDLIDGKRQSWYSIPGALPLCEGHFVLDLPLNMKKDEEFSGARSFPVTLHHAPHAVGAPMRAAVWRAGARSRSATPRHGGAPAAIAARQHWSLPPRPRPRRRGDAEPREHFRSGCAARQAAATRRRAAVPAALQPLGGWLAVRHGGHAHGSGPPSVARPRVCACAWAGSSARGRNSCRPLAQPTDGHCLASGNWLQRH